jgi:D-lactate dehydrogenase
MFLYEEDRKKEEHAVKILFYDTKSYDKESFEAKAKDYPDIQIEYLKSELVPSTAKLAKGYDAICAFVSSDVGTETIDVLSACGVKLILMRCAGFNNVDVEKATACGIKVMRVPGYSPEAVAEHAMALALGVTRRLHKAYVKVRENDFSLSGLMGFNFYQKTAGIVGTGKIGAAMARICRGFGMNVIAYDVYKNPDLDFVEYVSLDELLERSDLISLHCPLMDNTYHLINKETIAKMKDGVVLVNTSRGGLVKTDDLIEGIRARKFFGVGLDVYEEETKNVFEDRSDEILEHSTTARLLSFPNVMITSHQGFFTEEALAAISETTLQNAVAFEKGESTGNEVVKQG